MTSDRRFEQELPGLLDELYMGPMPSYRDHVLQQTARTRQRPGWSLIERWLPMVDVVRQPVLASPLPWRNLGRGLVLVALLVALVAALVVGSRPRLPQPFGPARNGLVAYASGGDIHTADPATGSATAIVTGPEWDITPRWSRDGTSLAFERKTNGNSGAGLVFVAQRDGSRLVQLTPEPLPVIQDYAFSPDGTELLISDRSRGVERLLVAATDGSQIRDLDLSGRTVGSSRGVTGASWRPPDGSEILFTSSGDGNGIYAVSAQGGNVRTIAEPMRGRNRDMPTWSPDGSLISYLEWRDASTLTVQTHILAADGTGDRILPTPPDTVWQAAWNWSNDGSRLLAIRGNTGGFEQSRPAVVPVDGSGPGLEIEYDGPIQAGCCSSWEWSPDDTSILGTPSDTMGLPLQQVVLDPVAGTTRVVSWTTSSRPSWQRLAN